MGTLLFLPCDFHYSSTMVATEEHSSTAKGRAVTFVLNSRAGKHVRVQAQHPAFNSKRRGRVQSFVFSAGLAWEHGFWPNRHQSNMVQSWWAWSSLAGRGTCPSHMSAWPKNAERVAGIRLPLITASEVTTHSLSAGSTSDQPSLLIRH